MGATSSVVTGKLDLRKKELSYDTFEQHMGILGDNQLAKIKELIICRNKLSALPPRVKVMVSLQEIRCTDNWLKWLPEELRTLPKLERLVVGGNQLASIDSLIPPDIRKLKVPATEENGEADIYTKQGPYSTLRTLRIGNNRVARIPLNFAQLYINLKTLVANKNGITVLPLDLLDLPMLEVLVASRNELKTLPPVNNPNIRLRCLVLSKNQFEEIPACMGKMKLLQKLLLDNNQVDTVPKALSALKYLYKLDMSMNRLTSDAVLNSGLLKSATLADLKLKPGNPDLSKQLSCREAYEASPLASPMRRMANSPLASPMSRASRDEASDYEDPSPRGKDD